MSVTVLITCYNEGRYLEQAIGSVLAQSSAAEITAIHVLDDGSDAETQAVLAGVVALDARLQIHRSATLGVARNRNRGVALSSTEFIAFLDADDFWAPEKLERQLAAFADSPDRILIYSGYWAFSDAGPKAPQPVRVHDVSRSPDQVRRYYLDDPPILPSSVLMRRSAFLKLEGGFEQECSPFEDTDFFLRLARTGPLKGIADPLIFKRYRAGSLSSRSPKLMMRHALVAFRAASFEPRLLPLAPRRLSERASQLGLVYLYARDTTAARRLALAAVAMNGLNLKAWMVLAISLGGWPLRTLLDPLLRGKARAHDY